MINRLKYVGLLIFLLTVSVYALGISIEPGGALMAARIMGEPIPAPPLRIVNINDKPMEYSIEIIIDKQQIKGYYPLPDVEWVSVEKPEFVIEAHDTFELPITINIPDEEANYNSAWFYKIVVTQTNITEGLTVGGSQIQLAATATWLIETPRKLELAEKSYGELSIAPSTFFIRYGDSTINKAEFPVKIRNNDTINHTYRFETYFPYYGDTIRGLKLDIMPLIVDETGFILDKSWVRAKPDKFLFFNKAPKLKLNPGESGEQTILIDLPTSRELNEQRYEAILLVKPDNGYAKSRFIRFIIAPGLEYVPPEDAE